MIPDMWPWALDCSKETQHKPGWAKPEFPSSPKCSLRLQLALGTSGWEGLMMSQNHLSFVSTFLCWLLFSIRTLWWQRRRSATLAYIILTAGASLERDYFSSDSSTKNHRKHSLVQLLLPTCFWISPAQGPGVVPGHTLGAAWKGGCQFIGNQPCDLKMRVACLHLRW